MFVLHVDTFKICTVFAPRSRTFKKPYGASLNYAKALIKLIAQIIMFLFFGLESYYRPKKRVQLISPTLKRPTLSPTKDNSQRRGLFLENRIHRRGKCNEQTALV